jgi:hypothetical protein
MDDERRRKIEQRAYEIWVREGQPAGREAEHWYHAEAEIAHEEAERAKREANQALNVAAQALQTAARAKRESAAGSGDKAAKTTAGTPAKTRPEKKPKKEKDTGKG